MTDFIPTCPAKRALLFEMWAHLPSAENVLRIQPGALRDPISFASSFPLRKDFAEECGLVELWQSPAVGEAEFLSRQGRRPAYCSYKDFLDRSAEYRVPVYMQYHFESVSNSSERTLRSSDGFHNGISFEPNSMIEYLRERVATYMALQRLDSALLETKLDHRAVPVIEAPYVLIHNTILGRATILPAARAKRTFDWHSVVSRDQAPRLIFPGAFIRLRKKSAQAFRTVSPLH